MRIECNRKLTDVARAGVAVEDLIQLFGVVRGSVDDLSILELEPDVVKSGPLINRGRVIGDVALDAVFDRRSEHFAIGNVVLSSAGNRRDAFDRKAQIGSGPADFNLIRAVHERLEGLHAGHHPGVIKRADVEIKLLKSLGAHARELGHGRRGPPQHAPLGAFDAPVQHGLHFAGHKLELRGGDIAHFSDVFTAADRDVGVHALHARQLHAGRNIQLRLGRTQRHFAADTSVLQLNVRKRSRGARSPHQGDGHFSGNVERVDEDLFALAQFGGERH